jgi:hypothetical protein
VARKAPVRFVVIVVVRRVGDILGRENVHIRQENTRQLAAVLVLCKD